MSILTFSAVASSIVSGYKLGKIALNWLTDPSLKSDFQYYLCQLETRKVLYLGWKDEDFAGVLPSLVEILEETRKFQSKHAKNKKLCSFLNKLIAVIQKESSTIRGCNMQSTQGIYMAYIALLKIRIKISHTLAILCGELDVSPGSTEFEKFVLDMAVVRVAS